MPTHICKFAPKREVREGDIMIEVECERGCGLHGWFSIEEWLELDKKQQERDNPFPV